MLAQLLISKSKRFPRFPISSGRESRFSHPKRSSHSKAIRFSKPSGSDLNDIQSANKSKERFDNPGRLFGSAYKTEGSLIGISNEYMYLASIAVKD